MERVGTAKQATITFHNAGRIDNPHTVNLAGIEGLNVYYQEAGDILVFNEGEYLNGFAICTLCGYADSERDARKGLALPAGFEQHTPLRVASKRVSCWKRVAGAQPTLRNQTLAARETTDVMMLDLSGKFGFGKYAEDADLMLTLARSLQVAAVKMLELDEREIGVMIVPTGEGGRYLGPTLYDNVPGGAGHVAEVLKRGSEWLKRAQSAMYVSENHNAACEGACLDCLLNFSAQFDKVVWKRREALALLDALLGEATLEAERPLRSVALGRDQGTRTTAIRAERARRRRSKP